MQGDSGDKHKDSDNNYELKDGVYHYTDSSGRHYKFDEHTQEWVQESNDVGETPTKDGEYKDEDGRRYYYTPTGDYACDDPHGNTYHYKEGAWVPIDKVEKDTDSGEDRDCFPPGEDRVVTIPGEDNSISPPGEEKSAAPPGESKSTVPLGEDKSIAPPGESKSTVPPGGSRWYFYKNQEAYYRDATNDKVYRMNQSTSAWEEEIKKGSSGVKRRKGTEEEEFDTDDEGDEDPPQLGKTEELLQTGDNLAPPGWGLDPCVTFEDGIYMKRDPHDGDGTPYEWDPHKKAWFPKVDETFLACYQLTYGFRPDGSLDPNPVKYDDVNENEEMEEETDTKGKGKKSEKVEKKQPGWFEVSEEDTLSVYVSGLPVKSFTEEDFVEFMTRCGLIARDDSSKNLKVKLYRDKQGGLKGDALCTYLKVESVGLALQILDGARIGANTVKVERAKFNLKGEYNPSLKPVKKKRRKDKEKEKKQKERLLDWRPDPMRGERKKHECVVIVRNVFQVTDDTTKEEVKKHEEAIQAHAQAFGEVAKVEAFERHPEGVVKVRFKDTTAADLCRITFSGRMYSGRRLVADAWDGKEKFIIEETEEERRERILKWEKYLEEN